MDNNYGSVCMQWLNEQTRKGEERKGEIGLKQETSYQPESARLARDSRSASPPPPPTVAQHNAEATTNGNIEPESSTNEMPLRLSRHRQRTYSELRGPPSLCQCRRRRRRDRGLRTSGAVLGLCLLLQDQQQRKREGDAAKRQWEESGWKRRVSGVVRNYYRVAKDARGPRAGVGDAEKPTGPTIFIQ